MQNSVVKKVEKVSEEHKNMSEQKQDPNKKQEIKKDRKSKNPFLPIKEFMKKQAEFEKEIKEANWNSSDRFAKYSI